MRSRVSSGTGGGRRAAVALVLAGCAVTWGLVADELASLARRELMEVGPNLVVPARAGGPSALRLLDVRLERGARVTVDVCVRGREPAAEHGEVTFAWWTPATRTLVLERSASDLSWSAEPGAGGVSCAVLAEAPSVDAAGTYALDVVRGDLDVVRDDDLRPDEVSGLATGRPREGPAVGGPIALFARVRAQPSIGGRGGWLLVAIAVLALLGALGTATRPAETSAIPGVTRPLERHGPRIEFADGESRVAPARTVRPPRARAVIALGVVLAAHVTSLIYASPVVSTWISALGAGSARPSPIAPFAAGLALVAVEVCLAAGGARFVFGRRPTEADAARSLLGWVLPSAKGMFAAALAVLPLVAVGLLAERSLPTAGSSAVERLLATSAGTLATAAVAMVAPVGEELLYRGLAFGVLRRVGGMLVAVLGSTLCFVFAHGVDRAGAWGAMAAVAALGLALSVCRAWTGSTIPPIVLHLGYNAAIVLVAVANA